MRVVRSQIYENKSMFIYQKLVRVKYNNVNLPVFLRLALPHGKFKQLKILKTF